MLIFCRVACPFDNLRTMSLVEWLSRPSYSTRFITLSKLTGKGNCSRVSSGTVNIAGPMVGRSGRSERSPFSLQAKCGGVQVPLINDAK